MDFSRAEYTEPPVIDGYTGRPEGTGNFGKSLIYGIVAAVIGGIGYGIIGFSGFMVSIVAIGVAWLIAKAMMTGSGGIGGRNYQVAAVVLTYFAVSLGEFIVLMHYSGIPMGSMTHVPVPTLVKYLVAGPFLALSGNPFNGGIGLLIMAIGMRAAWRMAAGGPGFGSGAGGPRVGPFGVR